MKASPTVTVWLASTQCVRRRIGHHALDEAELRRADRISLSGERDRFVASRALLRHVMTETSQGQIAPAQWGFVADRRGKPMVADGLPAIPFSLSHAEDCVAVAAGGSAPLGVDVEGLWREADSEVVQAVLTEKERCSLSALAEDARWDRFIRLWTIKEACAKATGDGVTIDFSGIEADLDPPSAVLQGRNGGKAAFSLLARDVSIADRRYHVSVAAIADAASGPQFHVISI